ncbi:MAG TPA: thioredoxin family protein [Planctomycetaceae bacterium]|nr:thioredoxin family protein [Planctomycetaceae bacterium]
MRSPWFALSFCLIAGGLSAEIAAAELAPMNVWMTDFDAAHAEAKRLNRPLLVHFYGNNCPPCRRMEKEVLNSPQLLKLLDSGFVAVKVCLEKPHNLKVQARFGVEVMPTDLILGPDGKVLSRTEGYPGHQNYLANVAQIEAKFAADGRRVARSDGAVEVKKQPEKKELIAKDSPAATSDHKPAAVPSAAPDKLVPAPTEPKKIADASVGPRVNEPVKKDDSQPSSKAAGEISRIAVALAGYCPVTLRSTRTWKAGSKEFSLVHDGQTFYLAAPDLRDEFKANPGHYAPRLMGCDPVVMAESDLAVRGNVKFGAFYDGALYLFETADSRAKFRSDPPRYSRLQQVLKPQDLQRIASAAAK